ncbi:MAG: hypothetical protein ABSC15_22510, partial [Terriglobales bacterium]
WITVWGHAWEIWWGAGVIGTICTVLTLYWAPSRWISGWVIAWVFLVAGYYVWRPYHVRLTPCIEVKQFTSQSTDTFLDGKRNGRRVFFQLMPKCLSDADIAECLGILTAVEMWDGFNNRWEPVESEAMFLEWSHADEKPITLYSGAEKRLNVFSIGNQERQIRPCVKPFPPRFVMLFNQLELRTVKAIKFNITVKAKECKAVHIAMKVQLGNDPFQPTIDLEQA